ncbi:hypothetical protein NQ315_012016 [Exocentrus adspersus]|uniref:DUF7041 domain-containing protein n=1 Tax=Exocentrus adspersus TaxID=1586481 RepID=A0AAV8VIJ3_9CUCU|nr:hypothetical protein NQ315_012016 [Exocentrus adspersus]
MSLPPPSDAPSAPGVPCASVDRVSLKIPPFYASDPELWFSLLEGSFDAAGITQDSTKYGYAVGGLEAKYAVEVRDIIVKPKNERSYKLLKTELIKRMGSSQEQNTRRLLENEPLGDRKPSQFLRHLRGLAGANFPDEVLQTLWLGRLPRQVQALLTAHKDLTLEKRAEIADSVADVYGPRAEVLEATGTVAVNARFDYLQSALTTALQELAAIKISHRDNNRRDRSRPRSRSRSRPRDNGSQHEKCWYHYKFGTQARKCREPCSFNAESPGNAMGSR